MFVKVSNLSGTNKCRILGWARTDPTTDEGFSIVDQATFIKQFMSSEGRVSLLGSDNCENQQVIAEVVEDWHNKTGIKERPFFSGTTADMAAIVSKLCLKKFKLEASDIDLIIGATNTGIGYPSLADHVKEALGDESSEADCLDVVEACAASAKAITTACAYIRSGFCKRVLVVCSEKATTLTYADNWKASNLFGDGAFAVVVELSDQESFDFFYNNSLPFKGNLNTIRRTEKGFEQNGGQVHKIVGRQVAPAIAEAVKRAGLRPNDIDHLVVHQPSDKSLDLLFTYLNRCEGWSEFSGHKHKQVHFTGNLSSASTGYIISDQLSKGIIKPGQRVLVAAFGSGIAISVYAFIVCKL